MLQRQRVGFCSCVACVKTENVDIVAPLNAAKCSMIVIAVSIIIGTIEIALQKGTGKINRAEMADKIFDCCLTSTLCVVSGIVSQEFLATVMSASVQQTINAMFAPVLTPILTKIFGTTAAAAFPMFSVFSYLVGSLIGFAVAELIHFGTRSMVVSFCVESECTFFGVVDQNYVLPQEVIDAIGVDVFEYEKFDYETFRADMFHFDVFKPESFEFDRFGIRLLRRGVIEFGKVGYLL